MRKLMKLMHTISKNLSYLVIIKYMILKIYIIAYSFQKVKTY